MKRYTILLIICILAKSFTGCSRQEPAQDDNGPKEVIVAVSPFLAPDRQEVVFKILGALTHQANFRVRAYDACDAHRITDFTVPKVDYFRESAVARRIGDPLQKLISWARENPGDTQLSGTGSLCIPKLLDKIARDHTSPDYLLIIGSPVARFPNQPDYDFAEPDFRYPGDFQIFNDTASPFSSRGMEHSLAGTKVIFLYPHVDTDSWPSGYENKLHHFFGTFFASRSGNLVAFTPDLEAGLQLMASKDKVVFNEFTADTTSGIGMLDARVNLALSHPKPSEKWPTNQFVPQPTRQSPVVLTPAINESPTVLTQKIFITVETKAQPSALPSTTNVLEATNIPGALAAYPPNAADSDKTATNQVPSQPNERSPTVHTSDTNESSAVVTQRVVVAVETKESATNASVVAKVPEARTAPPARPSQEPSNSQIVLQEKELLPAVHASAVNESPIVLTQRVFISVEVKTQPTELPSTPNVTTGANLPEAVIVPVPPGQQPINPTLRVGPGSGVVIQLRYKGSLNADIDLYFRPHKGVAEVSYRKDRTSLAHFDYFYDSTTGEHVKSVWLPNGCDPEKATAWVNYRNGVGFVTGTVLWLTPNFSREARISFIAREGSEGFRRESSRKKSPCWQQLNLLDLLTNAGPTDNGSSATRPSTSDSRTSFGQGQTDVNPLKPRN